MDNIKILKYDDIKNNGLSVINDLCDFLEIGYNETSFKKTNASIVADDCDLQLSEDIYMQLVNIYNKDLAAVNKLCKTEVCSSWIKRSDP